MTDYTELGLLHEMFTRQVEKTPNLIAVVGDDGTKLTYRELDNTTNILAKKLRSLGVIPESIVCIYLERCVSFTIAYIAILKAGGSYLPLDISYPKPLLTSIFEDANPVAVMTKKNLADNLSDTGVPCEILILENGWQDLMQKELHEVNLPPQPRLNLDNLAYTVYSSGTTGKPKGIQCPHRGAVFSYNWRHENYPYQGEEREACNVFFVWEMLRPLLKGAQLYVIPDHVIYDSNLLCTYLKKNEITRMLFTPSLLEAFLDADELAESLKSMRQIWFCGEVVTTRLLSRCIKILPWVQFVNLYSISECHDVAVADLTQWFNVNKDEISNQKFCPVGKLLPQVKVAIMNDDLEVQPVGVSGEIFVGGPTLARGYLNRPDLNELRFIKTPEKYVKDFGPRLYRAGDWGYMLSDGSLEICGRCDSMVKIRGYSIETQAVEAALISLPTVNSAVVIVHGEEGDDKFLAAYIVPEGQATKKEIRSSLKRRLPFYMIPSYFVFLTSIPILAASGKLDKKQLPPLDTEQETLVDDEGKPKTGTERKLHEFWTSILQLKAVDVMESFFDLGGHSLTAARLLAKVRENMNVDISVNDLFLHPTILSLAEFIDVKRGYKPVRQSSLVPVLSLQEEVKIHDSAIVGWAENNSVRIDMQLRAFWRSIQWGQKWAKGRVLLTGVTGFLGAFLLKDLLLQTKTHIFCIVRDLPEQKGIERIRSTLKQFGILGNGKDTPLESQSTVEKELEERVFTIKGDVALMNLGMTEEEYQYLSTEIDYIIHAAAQVNLIYPYQALHGPNVLGTQNIIVFACTNKIKPLHYISTNAVFPHGLSNCSETEDMSVHANDLTDGYSQSKWVAEQLVLLARDRGVPVAVYRLGNLSGDSQRAYWNPKDFTLLMIKACIESNSTPVVDWKMEMTPVDFVSSVIVQLTQRIMTSMGKIFHIINTEPMDARWVFEWLLARGYSIRFLPFTNWIERLEEIKDKNNDKNGSIKTLLDGMITDEGFFAKLSTYDNTNLKTALKDLNMSYPSLGPQLLHTYTSNLVSRKVLTKAGRVTLSDKPLADKVVVITGASSGIGSAVATTLARAGAMVALAGRRQNLLDTVKDVIEKEGGVAISVPTDVTSRDQVKELIKHTESTLGPVDILVNNAGVMYYTLMKNLHEDEWEKTVDVNCKGVLNGIGAVLPGMLERKSGHILNMSSDAGRKGFPGLAAYSGTKFFVEGLSQSLRHEVCGSGIRVTCIQPGNVKTDLTALNTDQEAVDQYVCSDKHQILDPDDIGKAVLYAVCQPSHVAVNEILVEPREEPV